MPDAPKPPATRPYMTRIPGRSPEVKTHLNVGQAKNAVMQYMKNHDGVTTDMQQRYYSGWTPRTLMTLMETIDGIQTGRRKYSSRYCGGEVWHLVDGEWELLYNFPNGVWEHELPWRAKEYEFFVRDEEADDV